MSWFNRSKSIKAVPKEDIWTVCKSCNAHIFKEEWKSTDSVCPKCNYHGRITCSQRIKLVIDDGTFTETNPSITPSDPLRFVDGEGRYMDKIKATVEKTKLKEAVLTGYGKINSMPVSIAVMDFRFFGGSLGSGTGEKILQAAIYAFDHEIPYIVFSASGGARMQEGMFSLMQMAKTCAGIARLREKNLPYISVLTDPTAGGVSASFAMMGDVNIAEPGALIAFAGRRVIEQTIKQKLPNNFQTAEYLLEHGFIDTIVSRKDLKNTIHQVLLYYYNK